MANFTKEALVKIVDQFKDKPVYAAPHNSTVVGFVKEAQLVEDGMKIVGLIELSDKTHVQIVLAQAEK